MMLLSDGVSIILIIKKNFGDVVLLFWYLLGYVMSQVVGEYYKVKGYGFDVIKCGVGLYIENGWYQDFDLFELLKEEDLFEIEKIMCDIIGCGLDIIWCEISKDEVLVQFFYDFYKVELIEGLLDDEFIIFYSQGDYIDLCWGLYFFSIGKLLQSFKLMSISGVYWCGNEKNFIFQCIYGVVFVIQKELDEYLFQFEEVKWCDYCKLGKEFELFIIDLLVGKGLLLWLFNGMVLCEELINFMKEQQFQCGYQGVVMFNIGNFDLYCIFGYYLYYFEFQFNLIQVDEEEYMFKFMNCLYYV